jgi:hypothetical protein
VVCSAACLVLCSVLLCVVLRVLFCVLSCCVLCCVSCSVFSPVVCSAACLVLCSLLLCVVLCCLSYSVFSPVVCNAACLVLESKRMLQYNIIGFHSFSAERSIIKCAICTFFDILHIDVSKAYINTFALVRNGRYVQKDRMREGHNINSRLTSVMAAEFRVGDCFLKEMGDLLELTTLAYS